MIPDALDFWNSIKGKIQQLIKSLCQNCLRIERYDVSTAPSNGKIGVKQPFGTEIFIKYSETASNVQVGDTVYVIWWHTMSNATAWKFYTNRDFVIEEGTINGWNYQKWKNGTVRCNGQFESSSLELTQINTSGIYFAPDTINLPFVIIDPIISGSSRYSTGHVLPIGVQPVTGGTHELSFYVYDFYAREGQFRLSFSIVGKWYQEE